MRAKSCDADFPIGRVASPETPLRWAHVRSRAASVGSRMRRAGLNGGRVPLRSDMRPGNKEGWTLNLCNPILYVGVAVASVYPTVIVVRRLDVGRASPCRELATSSANEESRIALRSGAYDASTPPYARRMFRRGHPAWGVQWRKRRGFKVARLCGLVDRARFVGIARIGDLAVAGRLFRRTCLILVAGIRKRAFTGSFLDSSWQSRHGTRRESELPACVVRGPEHSVGKLRQQSFGCRKDQRRWRRDGFRLFGEN